jgi:transposase
VPTTCGPCQKAGVKQVALAPRGQAPSAVDEKTARRLAKERALIEGSIGAIKSSRYNFNRPRARSVEMMGTCGQLAVLGFNINKLLRGLAGRRPAALVTS